MNYNLLKGKRDIIFGALNEQSIAWKVAEKAVDNRGNAGKRFGGDADKGHEAVAFFGVFHEIHRGKHAERHGNQQSEKRHGQRVHKRRQNRAVFGIVLKREQLRR